MSLFCAISGQPPLDPVLSIKSGTVYERQLITKYLRDNAGKDPITGDQLNDEDLVAIKTGEWVQRSNDASTKRAGGRAAKVATV